MSLRNALSVVVVKVTDVSRKNVLAVYRGDLKGYAFPGGMHEAGETWQQAGAREVLEETGCLIKPEDLKFFDIVTVFDNATINIIFATAITDFSKQILVPQESEVESVHLLNKFVSMVFPTHEEILKEHFK